MTTISLSTATEFYQRHENKLITLVVLLLSLYLLAFVAKLTWKIIPQNPEQLAVSTSSNIENPRTNNSTAINVNSLINLNLFGNAEATPAPVVEQNNEDVPETSLNLVLLGVVSSNDSSLEAAIIKHRNEQNIYSLGDKIEGTNATLHEIEVDRVIIKNRAKRETLMLDGVDFEAANKQRANNSSRINRVTSQSPKATVKYPNRPDPQALKEARAQLAESPGSFAEMISLSPHMTNQALIGYRVSPGKNPALFNSVGLKNGDIVVNLNGFDLSDRQQSFEALRELQQADSLQLEILRGGEYVSLDFDMQSEDE